MYLILSFLRFLAFQISVFFVSPGDAKALQNTAREPISVEAATEHVAAARLVGWWYQLDSDLLNSVAGHESNYKIDAISHEPGGKVSCGLFTPKPMKSCVPEENVLDGYITGAQHIRVDWLTAMRGNKNLALIGVAGGYKLICSCATCDGHRVTNPQVTKKVWIRPGVDACRTPQVFEFQANRIRLEREKNAQKEADSLETVSDSR